MIKLKNLSKYYYSKGMIASGLSGVSLELNFGEFVVVTGESGSGKTTLLNVISGLDSYEEGELFIDGVETSHYTSADFEEYRKKYIGNIFQEFNLVNSYTVFQNIELALLINGNRKKDVRKVVESIIEKVGLGEYRNTKCSRLSGGQKQRVAIARALAKETPIIVADEPTGNLDTVSAEGIVTLLKEISKDKLVIVVTHNYEQFESEATRVVKMSDGKIIEDKRNIECADTSFSPGADTGKISAGSQLRLGVRNTFNIIPKFLLLLLVFAFVVVSVTSVYTGYKYQDEERSAFGYNQFFTNYSKERIIIKRADNKIIGEDDYDKLESLENIKSIERNDMVVDTELNIGNNDFYFAGFPSDAGTFRGKADVGRAPTGKNEALLECDKDGTFMTDDVSSLLNKDYTFSLVNSNGEEGAKIKAEIVGIRYMNDTTGDLNWYGKVYMSEDLMAKVKENTYKRSSESSTTINGKTYTSFSGSGMYGAVPSSKVPRGEAYVPIDVNYLYKSENAAGNQIDVKIENIYFKDGIKPTITKAYRKENFEELTGFEDFDLHNGEIFVNNEDYNSLYENGYYQSSVYVKDTKKMSETVKELTALGFKPFVLKDHLMANPAEEFLSVIQIPFQVCFILAVFFIAYFVTRLIIKSRGVYFSTLRMLGLARKNIKRILDIELCLIVSIAYGLFLAFAAALKTGLMDVPFMKDVIEFAKLSDYIILYLILLFMAFLISRRFAKKIFKKTAMVTFREEA